MIRDGSSPEQAGGKRYWTPNGLALSCPAARASPPTLYGNSAGNTSSNFPHASRVSCSELLGGKGFDSGQAITSTPTGR